MKEIVTRLHKKKQIELAKSILEGKGYSVSKRLNESEIPDIPCGDLMSNEESIAISQKVLANPEDYGYDEYPEYLEIERKILDIMKKDKGSVIYSDVYAWEHKIENMLIDTGNDYFGKGYIETEDGEKYQGYIFGNRDGMMSFLLPSDTKKNTNESENSRVDELVAESSYIDPIRVNIKVSTPGASFKKDYDVRENITKSIQSVIMKPEILVDESDGSYQLSFPGASDWVRAIQENIKYNISSKAEVEKI